MCVCASVNHCVRFSDTDAVRVIVSLAEHGACMCQFESVCVECISIVAALVVKLPSFAHTLTHTALLRPLEACEHLLQQCGCWSSAGIGQASKEVDRGEGRAICKLWH